MWSGGGVLPLGIALIDRGIGVFVLRCVLMDSKSDFCRDLPLRRESASLFLGRGGGESCLSFGVVFCVWLHCSTWWLLLRSFRRSR